jgi:hypothetical protein
MAVVLCPIDPAAGTIKSLVQFAALMPGVTTVTAEASVHPGDLVLVVTCSLNLSARQVTIFPSCSCACALIGQTAVGALVEAPVFCASAIIPSSLWTCSFTPVFMCALESPATHVFVVSVVTESRTAVRVKTLCAPVMSAAV